MANVDYYNNHLKKLLDDPNSFSGTPGFAFARDQGLSAIGRSNSRMRGSGNALAELTKYATGLATQDYGNQVDRLGRLSGQEQQYDLGERRIASDEAMARERLGFDRERLGAETGLARDRLGFDRERFGTESGLARDRLGFDRESDMRRDATARRGQDYEYDLGGRRLGNERESNYLNYFLGADRNDLTAAEQQNNFNLANERNRLEWYRANTDRGSSRSRSFYDGEENRRRNRLSADPWGTY